MGKTRKTKIPSRKNERESMDELFDTVRYHPEKSYPKDKHGMTIVAPEPEVPDDE